MNGQVCGGKDSCEERCELAGVPLKRYADRKRKTGEGEATSKRLVRLYMNYVIKIYEKRKQKKNSIKMIAEKRLIQTKQTKQSKGSKQQCKTERHPNIEDIEREAYQDGWRKRKGRIRHTDGQSSDRH